MTDDTYAKETLLELATGRIQDALDRADHAGARVLWWDAGGFLRDTLEEACQALGIGFCEAPENPLTLRGEALKQGDTPYLWYVPQAKNGRDWFREIRALDREIECPIEQLAAELYDVQPWELTGEPHTTDETRAQLAPVLLDELSKAHGRPSLNQFKTRLLTGGHGSVLEHVLLDGWGTLGSEPDHVRSIRDRLSDEGVPGLAELDGPDAIVEATRRWAIAQTLIANGCPTESIPAPHNETGNRTTAVRALKRVLNGAPAETVRAYLATWWPEVIEVVEAPWAIAACPVDAALEAALWRDWFDTLQDGDHERCHERARDRHRVLASAYGATDAIAPWTDAWAQAEALAELTALYAEFDERLTSTPLPALYAAKDDGSWRIDRDVRHILTTGAPEEELPDDHPARESLPDLRSDLSQRRYLSYLEALGGKAEEALEAGKLTEGLPDALRWWHDHKDHLDTGASVIFYIDALRLDLAHELADRLRELDEYEVREETRAGILPSETEFGMGALTPSSPMAFTVELSDKKLRARKNDQTLSTNHRKKLLKDYGWQVWQGADDGMEGERLAVFDKQIDDYGENELNNMEGFLRDRVHELAQEIHDTLRRGDWHRAYVVTDHGFVLLPPGQNMEAISPKSGAVDIQRRRLCGEGATPEQAGVLIGGDRGPPYLREPVRILVRPLQRFRKQRLTDVRFFHGGGLPQECILSFLTIERP